VHKKGRQKNKNKKRSRDSRKMHTQRLKRETGRENAVENKQKCVENL